MNPVRTLFVATAATLLVSLLPACDQAGGDTGLPPVACVVPMATELTVPTGSTAIRITFPGSPPPATSIDRGRRVAATFTGALSQGSVGFTAFDEQTDEQSVEGTLRVELPDNVPVTEITLMVPLLVAGQEMCGTATTRALPAAVSTDPDCTQRAVMERTLQERLREIQPRLDVPDARLFARVPLVPMAGSVSIPMVGGLTDTSTPLPIDLGLPAAVSVRFSVTWGIRGVAGYASEPDGSPVPLGRETSAGRVLLRALPPVLGVSLADGPPPGSVQPEVTVAVKATIPECGVAAASPTVSLTGPHVALPLPRVLALYRAPEMGPHYPSWREGVPHTRNSGVVAFGSPVDLSAPTLPLVGLLEGGLAPDSVPQLRGLGQRLAEIQGPVMTRHGAAGLAALPTGAAVPPDLAAPVRSLAALSETIGLFTRSFGDLAALNAPNGRYARLLEAEKVRDLGTVPLIDGEGLGHLPVHAQDEVEAALLLGPSGSAADLYVLADFRPEIRTVIHTDAGMARVSTARDGYVAVIPDLAVVPYARVEERRCGERANGSIPGRTAEQRFGAIRIHVAVDGDRSGLSEPPHRTGESESARRDNERRAHTLSRTASSFRLGDISMSVGRPSC
jgi:hypothetical protein